ncbi:Fc.00g070470.m01.CDS01 [Cosmosporella sp. VM-42]
MLNISTPEPTPAGSSSSSSKSSSSTEPTGLSTGSSTPAPSITGSWRAGPPKASRSATGPSTPSLSTSTAPVTDKTKALSDVLMGLRKLREGIVGSKRADDFAIQVYLFCIRVAILAKEPESYHPAILHLLRYIRLIQPMTSLEIEEVASYLILDAACRRKDLITAYELRREFNVRTKHLHFTLDALAHDNWLLFRRLKQEVDRHQLKIMEYADNDMRLHTLKCFGRTYLSVDLQFLETTTERKWSELKEKDGVGWELDGDKVVIRRVRAR